MYDMPCGKARLIEGDSDELMHGICSDEYFGFVECSMCVKKEHYNTYIDVPPFYVTKEIEGETKLSSYMECENVLISTELFKWYVSQHVLILKTSSVTIVVNHLKVLLN